MDIDLKWLAGLDKHDLFSENGVCIGNSDDNSVSSRKNVTKPRNYRISISKLVEEIPPLTMRGGVGTEGRKKREESSKRRKLQVCT